MPSIFKKLSISLPPELVELLDVLVEKGLYATRSEIIREALYLLLWDLVDSVEIYEKVAKEASEKGVPLDEYIDELIEKAESSDVVELIRLSGLSLDEIKILKKKIKKIQRKLERNLYYI